MVAKLNGQRQTGNAHLLLSPTIYHPGWRERPFFCSWSVSLAWRHLPGLLSLLSCQRLRLALSGRTPGPPTASAREGLSGRPFFLRPHAYVPRYLVLEFPILKEPQLILTVQIVSINVAEVYLRTERGSAQIIRRSYPTADNVHTPG